MDTATPEDPPVEVVPYSENWPALFVAEAALHRGGNRKSRDIEHRRCVLRTDWLRTRCTPPW